MDPIWLSSYPDQVPHHLEYPSDSLAQILVNTSQKYPTHEAIYFQGKKITYQTLLDSVYRFANALKFLGVKKGDRVAIMLPNTPQSVISYYATLMIGAVVVQTNPLYTERELQHQLADAQVKVILTLDLTYKKVVKVKELTSIQSIIVTSIKDYLPFPKNWLYSLKMRLERKHVKIGNEVNTYSFESLLKSTPNHPQNVDIDTKKDIALLQYTGGTTGQAKGVMLSHHNLIANVIQVKHWLYKARPGQERVLGALPFFHVFGMTAVMNFTIMIGASMILIPRFDVTEILKTIQKTKPTFFPGAPTMYIAINNHSDVKKYNLSSIEACISGSAPLPLEVQETFESLTGSRLVEGYGLTETSPVTHANPIWGKRKNGSIGIPWPDTEAKIVNGDTWEEVELGNVGELAVKGNQIMMGYWNRPEETSKIMNNGWLLTGDIAKVDNDGYFYIVDRKKDVIIAGGFNVYPREVEEVLYEHPAIKEAAVVGIPDPYRGETVKAYVVFKDGKEVTEKELIAYTRKNLAAYKIPRQYEFRSELPKTIVGKVLKRALLEEELKKSEQTA